jgi:hypothetical protein
MNRVCRRCAVVFVAAWAVLQAGPAPAADPVARPRVIVLTDIENEPDDAMSLVRFLVYANQWDTEALIATTSVHLPDRVAPARIEAIVTAYGAVRDALEVHERGFPTGDHLLSLVRSGAARYGMTAVGSGHDSPGSERIIEVVDADDPRPIWVCVWGGPNCLAQALWKVRATRTPEALARFVAKLRVYTISDQDDSGPWLRRTFPDLFYVASPGVHQFGGYHYATWIGIAGDEFHGRFAGGDFAVVSQPWLDEHVRCKGPLGAEYPPVEFIMEGDTPSFLNLIATGLANPEHPDWGGWGGRYELACPPERKWHMERETRPFWTDAVDEVKGADGRWHTDNWCTIWRWRRAFQNDFSSRMDWTVTPRFEDANHPPVPRLGHARELRVPAGGRITLSATVAPEKFGRAGTAHVVLAVTDAGTPPLTRYERVIVTVEPPR